MILKSKSVATPIRLFAIILILSFSTACGILVLPSQMVSLGAYADPGQTKEVFSGRPDGTSGGLFTVPPDHVLVITRVIIHPIPLGSSSLTIQLQQSDNVLGDRIKQTWHVTNSKPTEFDFTPGYVISSGSILKIKSESASSGGVHVSMYGYLAADK